jgi:hypothetical protein
MMILTVLVYHWAGTSSFPYYILPDSQPFVCTIKVGRRIENLISSSSPPRLLDPYLSLIYFIICLKVSFKKVVLERVEVATVGEGTIREQRNDECWSIEL